MADNDGGGILWFLAGWALEQRWGFFMRPRLGKKPGSKSWMRPGKSQDVVKERARQAK